MLASIRSAAVVGIDAYDVTVEVDVANGLPQWTIVGLAASAVKESRERVGAALVNAGFQMPPRRVTVNLAPADIRKEGTAFDLPIALGMLVGTGQLDPDTVRGLVALGELGLDGTLRPIRGALPVARHLARSAKRGASRRSAAPPALPTLVLPPPNVAEASLVSALPLATAETLAELVTMLRAGALPPAIAEPNDPATRTDDSDMADVVAQAGAKRALEIAAAGGHAVLMVGPPGAGKTMLARRMPTILPALSEEEALEVIAIHSVAGLLHPGAPPARDRPFRAPHHTLSTAALIGGGSIPRPGEVSLAHHGVLFIDELQEMPRSVLDALRQPLEDGRVLISRAATTVSFPARFTLVGAMNPCPCGRAGEPGASCSCATTDVLRHRARISGPLADRIDMHVHVSAVPLRELAGDAPNERSADIRVRVEQARATQRTRYSEIRGVRCNAHAHGRWLDANTPVERDARELLASAAERLALSARGYHRVLKVARTIADLDQSLAVIRAHVAEALRYRSPSMEDPRHLPAALECR